MRRLHSDVERWLTPERTHRYPIMLFAITALVYLSSAVRSQNWIEPDGRIIGHDYLAFFMAGDLVNQGRIGELYDFAAQQAYQQQFMAEINPTWSRTCLYLNPPHYAWAMSWLARLGYGPSLIAWWLLSAICFGLTVVIWRGWLGRERLGGPLLLAICMSSWFLAFAGGQNSFFSLLILTAFCGLMLSGREMLAGLVLAALAFKFQLLLVPAGMLLFKARWRALGGLALGGGLTLLATVALSGWDVLGEYVRFGARLGELLQMEGFDVHKQHSWHGLFSLAGQGWMPPVIVRGLTAAGSLASLVVLWLTWRGAWVRSGARLPLQLAALMVATLLTSPHLFHYDVLIATLPAMLWVRAARADGEWVPRESLKVLMAGGFVWLAFSPLLSGLLHVQLSPLLMLWWMVRLRREVKFAGATPCAELPEPG
ncbi:MAG: DUF2029 domain-containing protein [bacterium]|nr:DUF2029 domain-containing protein [bacterium]